MKNALLTCFVLVLISLKSHSAQSDSLAQGSFDVDSFKRSCFLKLDTAPVANVIQDCSFALDELRLDSLSRLKVLMFRGYFYTTQDYLTLAYEDFKEAIQLTESQENQGANIGYCAKELGKLSNRLGLFDQAKIYQDLALTYADRKDSVFLLNDRAVLQKSYGEHESALRTLNVALKINNTPSFGHALIGNKIDLFLSTNQLDSAKLLMDDLEQSNAELVNDIVLQLELYKVEYFTVKKQPQKAIEKLKQAQLLLDHLAMNDREIELSIHIGLAKNWLLSEQYHHNHQFLHRVINDFIAENESDIPPKFLELLKLNFFNLLKYRKATQNDMNLAIKRALFVLQKIEHNRMSINQKAFLASYLKQIMESCYAFYGNRGLELKDSTLTNFLQLSEYVRAVQLQEKLQINALSSNNLTYYAIQKEIDLIQLQLSHSKVTPAEKVNLNFQLEDWQKKTQQLKQESDSEKKYLLNSTSSSIIYFVGEDSLYLLYTINEKAKVQQIKASVEKVEQLIKELNITLEAKTDHFYEVSHELYQLLWPQTSNQLPFQMIILPDGMLYQIPFEALVRTPSLPVQFLIHQHSIEYSYTFREVKENTEPTKEYVLTKNTFIHNSFQDDADYSYIPIDKNPINYLDNFSTQLLQAKLGLKALFLKALETDDLVHLTSHGTFNNKTVQLFFEGDSPLEIKDIKNRTCNAQLVMMNSCESALGEVDEIEGTLNFAYALQYAGCGNVSVNLWKSNASSSQKILANFLIHLKSSYLAESLRKSKLEFLRDEETSQEMTHPYYWASPILYSTSSVKTTLKKEPENIVIIIILGLLLVFTLFILNSRLR